MKSPRPRPAAGPGGLERRRAERVPMPRTGATVSVVGATLATVSPYGMMIVSPVPLEPGAILSFRLVVAGVKTDVDARVVACARLPGGGRRHGAGLEFTRIAPGTRELLSQVLAELHAPTL